MPAFFYVYFASYSNLQMQIAENISLRTYNTFGINVTAQYFATFSSIQELNEIYEYKQPSLIIGGGSNILLTQNVPGLVAKNNVPGIEVVNKTGKHVFVKSGAGISWHELVLYLHPPGIWGNRKPEPDTGKCRCKSHAKHWGLWCRFKQHFL